MFDAIDDRLWAFGQKKDEKEERRKADEARLLRSGAITDKPKINQNSERLAKSRQGTVGSRLYEDASHRQTKLKASPNPPCLHACAWRGLA